MSIKKGNFMWQGVDKYRCHAAVIIKALDNYYNSLVKTTQLNETKSNRNKTICSLNFHGKNSRCPWF